MLFRILGLFLTLLLVGAPASAADRPNIVFILIDDLRHDTFGFMGHPFVETPHVDRLARGGARFTNAFVTTSLCSPARASFLTGQYMHNHKVVDNQSRIPEGTVTFPQLLQQSGYRTAFIGKWHMGGTSDAPRPGFDRWVSFRGQGTYAPERHSLNVNGDQVPRTKYMTDELTDYAVDWLNEQDVDKPFLLYLSHKGVHGLYDPAPRHRGRYQDADWKPPATMANSPENYTRKPMWVRDQRNSWHGVEFAYYGRSEQTTGEMYRHYCEMILSIDDSVGQVMAALQKNNAANNTLVLFTSDGGHLWGEHGLIDKRCAYEESMRIPLIAHCPNLIQAGKEVDATVANIDVSPTLLELAGVPVPETIDGRSFLELFGSEGEPGSRAPLLYEYYWEWSYPQTPTTFALRDQRYKLIQYHGIWDTDELYDLQQDPRETCNLINDPEHRERVSRMREALHEQLQKTGGLQIPLGHKRGAGANLRSSNGSERSEFPETMIRPNSD